MPDSLPVAHWLDPQAAPADVVGELLHEVIDPELGINIVDLGLVYGVQVEEQTAHITMTLTTPGCPLSAYLQDAIEDCLWGAPGVEHVAVRIVWDPPWSPEQMSAAAKQALGWDR